MTDIVQHQVTVLSQDTWNGLTATFTIDGAPMEIESAQMAIRLEDVQGNVQVILKSPEHLTVELGSVQILPIRMDLVPGYYIGDMRLTTGDETRTYLRLQITVNATTNG